ncbi:hypothetical protein BpHYR1_007011 [Brachionus plicatilis]|uniref:Uncharacterized protein n=1 Tax=Brachionus plicatilis TaxID=10195 RepID=A0A3M7SFC4_BRAPC|nr:hypothetical protein BpHYR1_007011 [Brachionus plicatilis]
MAEFIHCLTKQFDHFLSENLHKFGHFLAKIFYLNNQHIIIKNTHRTNKAMYIPEYLNQGSAMDPLKFSDITYRNCYCQMNQDTCLIS